MPERERLEDRISKIVADAISARDRRQAEEKDPNKAWLRQAIREEVGAALEGLLTDKGDASGSRRRRRDDDDDEGGSGILGLFGA